MVSVFAPERWPARFVTADIFADSPELPVFQLRLREGEAGLAFTLSYGVLPQAEARMRMDADAITQNRWQFLREGAWLKPTAGGSRVDLSRLIACRLWRCARASDRFDGARRRSRPRRRSHRAGTTTAAKGRADSTSWDRARRVSGRENASVDEMTARPKHSSPARLPASGRPGLAMGQHGGDAPAHRTTRSSGRITTAPLVAARPDGHPFWSAGIVWVRVDTPATYDGLERALGGPRGMASSRASTMSARRPPFDRLPRRELHPRIRCRLVRRLGHHYDW